MNDGRSFFFVLVFATAAGVFLSLPASAADYVSQDLQFSGSPNPVGSGARALGMGGAFIGVADDATAASWNPGGLIQLETPEVSVVLSGHHQREHRTFADTPGASGTETMTRYDVNYLSAAFPFTVSGYNMIVSLNYQTLYEFNREAEASFTRTDPYPGPAGDREIRRKSEGYLKALSPAFAVQVTPDLSFGATMNRFSRNLGCNWDTEYSDRLFGSFRDEPFSYEVRYDEESEFDGMNFHLGILFRVNGFLTIGLVYKSPFDADVNHRQTYSAQGSITQPETVIIDEDRTLKMPPSCGIGAALRFSDRFSMDLDLYRTDWGRFVLEQADGRRISPFTGRDASETDTAPTHQVRLGGEYLYIRDKYVLAARAGIFYDPEPSSQKPDDFFGVSLGTGFAWGSFVMDAAWQYRWGNNVRKIYLLNEEIEQDVEQHVLYASLIYHF